MSFRKATSTCAAIFSLTIFHGCSQGVVKDQTVGTGNGATPMLEEISSEARQLDRTFEDGWIVGRDPRTFKTAYGRTTAQMKARFAVDYAARVGRSGQDLVNNWSSYLPYSTRAQFALQWWQRDPDFRKLDERKQNIWVHEALLDASELYWRITERRLNPGSAQVVAHDVEQNMVYKFMENDHTEGTWGDFRKTAAASGKMSQQ